ncbi:MAG: phosphonate C-P lyase system protein PhnG [Spiribacter sp.]|nr:phosphonate C-P lyase system protein PhnG [Spiribacter sp.]
MTTAPDTPSTPDTRAGWMSLLACVSVDALAERWEALALDPAYTWLRAPEIGAVMVRGRAGGTGAPFNLGEMTVTRCTLRLDESGATGHAYVQGRAPAHARRAALVDALMHTDAAPRLTQDLLAPLQAERKRARSQEAARAQTTKVDFFTLVRGEDSA